MTEHQDMEQRRRKTIAWGVGIAGPLIGGLLIAAGLSIQAILMVLAALALMGILLTLRLPRCATVEEIFNAGAASGDYQPRSSPSNPSNPSNPSKGAFFETSRQAISMAVTAIMQPNGSG